MLGRLGWFRGVYGPRCLSYRALPSRAAQTEDESAFMEHHREGSCPSTQPASSETRLSLSHLRRTGGSHEGRFYGRGAVHRLGSKRPHIRTTRA